MKWNHGVNALRPQQFDALKADLPAWTLIMVLSAVNYRPEEKMKYQEDALKNIMLYSCRQLELVDTLPVMLGAEKKIPEMLSSHWPGNRTYWKHAYKGSSQDLVFMTTLERVKNFVPLVNQAAAKFRYPAEDIGCYVQPVENGRACQVDFSFFFDPKDKAEVERIRELYTNAAAAVFKRGAWFNRPYGSAVTDMIYKKYANYAATVKRFKKYADPNNIMNPGTLCF
jgi:hypothetical protein